jgi:hypothetical protein
MQGTRKITTNNLNLYIDFRNKNSYNIDNTILKSIVNKDFYEIVGLPNYNGESLNFNEYEEYVDFGDILGFEKTESFSIEIECYPFYGTSSFVEKLDDNDVGYKLGLENEKIVFGLYGTSSELIVESSDNIELETWNTITVSYDGSSNASGVKLYINYSQIQTNTVSDNLNQSIINNDSLYLSKFSANGISFLRIYDIVLDVESKENYNSMKFRNSKNELEEKKFSFADIFGSNYYDDWDFNDSDSLDLTGNNINSIASLTGSGRSFTQSGGARPTLTFDSTINKNVAFFDGVANWMQVLSSNNQYNFLHNSEGGLIIVIGRYKNPVLSRLLTTSNSGSGSVGVISNYDNRNSSSNFDRLLAALQQGSPVINNATFLSPNYSATNDKYNILIFKYNISDPTINNRLTGFVNNDVEYKSNTLDYFVTTGNSSHNLHLGRVGGFTSFYMNGSLARTLIIKGIPTIEQIQKLINRLKYEYGNFPI